MSTDAADTPTAEIRKGLPTAMHLSLLDFDVDRLDRRDARLADAVDELRESVNRRLGQILMAIVVASITFAFMAAAVLLGLQ